MSDVLFLSNPQDDAEMRKIKEMLEENKDKLNYSIKVYDEVRKDDVLEKLIKEKKIRVIVLFMGYGSLYPEISSLLRRSFKIIPSIVVILRNATEPIQIPIFLQALQYVDFRRELPDEALEHLNRAISERFNWEWP